jgi:hypothetical protein
MDSLQTGSTQSLLIVVAVAFSPAIVLSLVNVVGWFVRQQGGKGAELQPVRNQEGSSNNQCSD